MNPPSSSHNRFRILFWLWSAMGVALIGAAFSPQFRKLERNRLATESLEAAREALGQVRSTSQAAVRDEEALGKLLDRAASRARECTTFIEAERPDAALVAGVELALVDLESGRAFAALEALLNLADKDRPRPDAPWTANTPVIESAIAETRYKIAQMCREEGDGYESWSKYSEAAARSYHELALRARTDEEKDLYLRNLAACTRLLYGGDEYSQSLGFPARRTTDCAMIARVWRRPPPVGGGGETGEPWTKPPEPNETTQGR